MLYLTCWGLVLLLLSKENVSLMRSIIKSFKKDAHFPLPFNIIFCSILNKKNLPKSIIILVWCLTKGFILFRLVFYNNLTFMIYNYLVFLCYPADARRSSLVFLCENIYCYYLFSNECRKHNNYLLFHIKRTRNVWRASTRDKRWHVQLKGIFGL